MMGLLTEWTRCCGLSGRRQRRTSATSGRGQVSGRTLSATGGYGGRAAI